MSTEELTAMIRPLALASALALMLPVGATAASAASTVKPTAVDKVYAQAEQSLRKLGVYHATTMTTTTTGSSTVVSSSQVWVDAGLRVGRSTTTYDVNAKGKAAGKYNSSRELLAAHVRWVDGAPHSPLTCHHAEATVGMVLGCPFSELPDRSAIMHGVWHGHKVLLLVVHTSVFGESATILTKTVTYLDPKTALPLAGVATGTYQTQKTLPRRAATAYQSRQLSRTSLPKTFFNPAALGWKAPNPLKGLPHGLPVYWPGRTWTPSGGLPAITLQFVEFPIASAMPFYKADMEYALASDPYGPVVLMLSVWTANDWAKAKVGEPIPLCKPVSQVTLVLGTATFRCPDDKVDGPFADLDAPGAHITVDAPSFEAAGKVTFSPYATLPALQTVLNALRVRP